MKPCPNCGQDVSTTADRFCPHCGYLLPWAASIPNSPAQQPPQQAAQPSPAPAGQATYTARPTYAQPRPGSSGAPGYTTTPASPANLPLPRVQSAPTPVAPPRGSDPAMNTMMTMLRSITAMDAASLLRLAVVVLVALAALFIVTKIIASLLAVIPWVLIVVAIIYVWQRQQRRGRWF